MLKVSLSVCLSLSLSRGLSPKADADVENKNNYIRVQSYCNDICHSNGETHLNDMMVLLVHNYPTVGKHQQTARNPTLSLPSDTCSARPKPPNQVPDV